MTKPTTDMRKNSLEEVLIISIGQLMIGQDYPNVDKIVKTIMPHIKQEQLALLERLEKNGHGGGNFRRLIQQEKERLK